MPGGASRKVEQKNLLIFQQDAREINQSGTYLRLDKLTYIARQGQTLVVLMLKIRYKPK